MSGRAERRVAVPRPPMPWLLRWPGLALAAAVALAYRGAEGDVGALFAPAARAAMADFAGGFFPPKVDPEFLSTLWRPLGETLAIAILGMLLALVLAAPLSLVAMRPFLLEPGERASLVRRAAYRSARVLLNLMRSIPELIWALLFVRALGIGPAPGVLGIGIAYAGVIGKVFAEIFESTPPRPARALVGAGATPARAFAFGVLPQSAPLLVSYALYRFDCALRASAILGLVGAGGIGQHIELSLKMFAYDEMATALVALFALVFAADQLSVLIRRRLRDTLELFPTSRAATVSRSLITAGFLAAAALSAWFLELHPSELFSASALRGMGSYLAGLFPPDLSHDFVAGLLPAALQTLAISVLGSALAAVLGFALALLATRGVQGADEVSTAAAGPLGRLLRIAVRQAAKGVLNLGRTLPELVWALTLIFAVGLGPFAGALALGIHNAGVLGRLFTEVLEEVAPAPIRALRLTGAKVLPATWMAALPQALPQLIAYALYRWEVNIRASAVLGVVGAGGLGMQLHLALSLFHYQRAATIILAILVLVTAVDLLSGWIRGRVMAGQGTAFTAGHRGRGLELLLGDQRLLVLGLSPGGARVFAPAESRAFAHAAAEQVLLDPDLARIACTVRVVARREEPVGTFVDLRLERLGPLAAWKVRKLGRRADPRAERAQVRAEVAAW